MSYLKGISISFWLLLTGCIENGNWHSAEPIENAYGTVELPWCGQDQHIHAESRSVSAPFANTNELRYMGCHKENINILAVIENLETVLEKSNLSEDWSKNANNKIVAPYTFVLISVSPEIVVACQDDAQHSKNYPGQFDSKKFVKGISIATTITCSNFSFWFTSETQFKANEFSQQDKDSIKIAYKNVEFELTKVGPYWLSSRK